MEKVSGFVLWINLFLNLIKHVPVSLGRLGIYEVFSGRKNFDFGKQPEPLEGTNTVMRARFLLYGLNYIPVYSELL